jgi:hypothetical protein
MPSGGDTAGGKPSPSGSATRAAFRQDPNRFVISNPFLSASFSSSHGALVSLLNRPTQVELIDEGEAASEGVLWRCRIASADGSQTTLTSRDCREFTHAVESESGGSLRLRLTWTGLRIGAEPVAGQATITVAISADSPSLSLALELQLPDHLSAASIDFPCVSSIGSSDPLGAESLFLPLSGGLLVHEPRASLALRGGGAVWQAAYPGPASMQFLGFSASDRSTAWLGARDGSGARKSLAVGKSARSDRVSLWIVHEAARQADGRWTPGCPAAIGVVTGDWFEAAREYRSWAVHQPWCGRGRGGERGLPALTSSYGLWLSHWGSGKAAVAATRELQRAVNVPIKLDWRCWHRCLYGGAYPDYFPPRDGDQVFVDVRRHLAESGVLSQLSLNGVLASPESEAWQEGAAAAAAADGGGSAGLAIMCPASAYWREKLVALAHEVARYGVEGVHFQDLGSVSPAACGDAAHGHPVSPTSWTSGVRQALSEIRAALGKAINLSTDGPNETCLHLVDAFVTYDAAAEREATVPAVFGDRWSPIPLFAAVYHEYSTLVGPGSSLVTHRPHDPLDTAAGADFRAPAHVMSRDFLGQYCLEIARAAAWGQQIMVANFSPEQAQNDSSRKKLSFLSTVMRAQAWGVGALLAYSEFAGMLQVRSHQIDVDLLVNPPRSQASQRRVMRGTTSPVLGSAWRTPGGGPALVLINIHDQDLEFATRLRASRLGVHLPVQMIGRTFSEDGDVPAATLRASGNEVSGRLPGRSVVLLTLR